MVGGVPVASLLSSLLFHPHRIGPAEIARCDPGDLVTAAEAQQVVPFALRGLLRVAAPDLSDVPIGAHIAAMQEALRRWTLYEALQRRAVAEALDRVDVPILFFKGAALAYSLYESPADRMRLDWDLLVEHGNRDIVERALLDAGFVKDVKTPGRIRVRQQSYRRPIADGECAVDLHTGFVNAPALASRMSFADFAARSVPLPALHRAARGPDDVDALIAAAAHRLVHHPGERRLIWDIDILRLAARAEGHVPRLLDRAAKWGVGPLVAHEVRGAAARSGEPLRPGFADTLARLAAQPSDLLMFTREDRSRGDDFALDWRALGWRDRAALVRETFMPDAAFVRADSGSRLPMPLLYLRRLAAGAPGWFRRPSRPADPDPDPPQQDH